MNRRNFFMRALAASLGVFGLGNLVKAEEPEYPRWNFKYSKFFRRADQATMDEFKNIFVIDEAYVGHKVPVIWANDEKTASCIVNSEQSKISLPIINIYRGDLFFSNKIMVYYHLTMSSLYEEDMNQMLEQVILKFSPHLKNKIGEYELMSIVNNYMASPMRGEIYSGVKNGGQVTPSLRILKYHASMLLTMEGRP